MAFPSRFHQLIRNVLPPRLVAAVNRRLAPPDADDATRDSFYASLVPPSGTCFDIGANVGNRLASFRRNGFKVVALEPQTKCYVILQSTFAGDPNVTLIKKAVGRSPGKATMNISDWEVLSTLSKDFIDITKGSGRFKGMNWNKSEEVEVTTLDALIAEFGVPDFIKIDVEGFELEVVEGLSQPIKLISLEWTPELTATTLQCIERLNTLGKPCFNFSWGESMKMSQSKWMDKREITSLLNAYRKDTFYFGDVYIRYE